MSTTATTASQVPTFPDLDFELSNTRRMLERLPQQHWAYRPHASSMSMIELAAHIVGVMRVAESTVREASFDLQAGEHIPHPADTSELLRAFDERAASLKSAIVSVKPESWKEKWQLKRGETVVRDMPREIALRIVGLNHILHHRAQLSVYLRLNGVAVPGMYGPSADER